MFLIDRETGKLIERHFRDAPIHIRVFLIVFGICFVTFLTVWVVGAVTIGLRILRG